MKYREILIMSKDSNERKVAKSEKVGKNENYVAQTYEEIIKEHLDDIYKTHLDRLVDKLFG